MMSEHLVITVSLVTGRFHGRGQNGEPEWPPSPFRLFQALVAGAAHTTTIEVARPAFQWLEQQSIDSILTPPAYRGEEVTSYVLTNQRDRAIGTSLAESKLKSAKSLKPMILSDSENMNIFYIFHNEAPDDLLQILRQISQGVSHYGHGVDAAYVRIDNLDEAKIQKLPGEQWTRSDTAGNSLSIPYDGALVALERSYESWRLQTNQIHKKVSLPPIPVPRLAFQNYRHEEHPISRVYRLFELHNEDGTYASLPDSSNAHLAGMIRHLTTDPAFAATLGWSPEQMAMLHGHAEARGETPKIAEERFGFIGLPTLRWAGKQHGWRVDNCRRLLLTAAEEYSALLDELVIRLHQRNIKPLGEKPPLRLVSVAVDSTTKRYVQAASCWATVTPMILPNPVGSSNDRRRLRDSKISMATRQSIMEKIDRRIDAMIRNTIVNAGMSRALAQSARIRWNRSGFWPGVSPAKYHSVTKHYEKHTLLHVEIEWFTRFGAPLEISGPLTLGACAHAGLGLFAPVLNQLEMVMS